MLVVHGEFGEVAGGADGAEHHAAARPCVLLERPAETLPAQGVVALELPALVVAQVGLAAVNVKARSQGVGDQMLVPGGEQAHRQQRAGNREKSGTALARHCAPESHSERDERQPRDEEAPHRHEVAARAHGEHEGARGRCQDREAHAPPRASEARGHAQQQAERCDEGQQEVDHVAGTAQEPGDAQTGFGVNRVGHEVVEVRVAHAEKEPRSHEQEQRVHGERFEGRPAREPP